MMRQSAHFRLIHKAVSLIVIAAFLAADMVCAAPLLPAGQSSTLAPVSHSQAQYQEERDAYHALVTAKQTSAARYAGHLIVVTIMTLLMLLTPMNVDAREVHKKIAPAKKDAAVKTTASKKRPGPQETLPAEEGTASMTEIVTAYVSQIPGLVKRGFEQKKIEDARRDAEQTVEFSLQTYLNDPLIGIFQDFALPMQNVKRISSKYGMRMHPIKKVLTMHYGIDLAAHKWTDMYSAYDGKVVEVNNDYDPDPTEMGKGYGNVVKIATDINGVRMVFVYGHLSKAYVRENEPVDPGTLIGGVGTTGGSTGPHLHFEVLINGKHIDPAYIINVKTLKEWGAEKETIQKRQDLENRFNEVYRLMANGLTLENAPAVLDQYTAIFEMLELGDQANNVRKARERLDALQKELQKQAKGETGSDPQKPVDDFLKYLSLVFGGITIQSFRKREEDRMKSGIADLIKKDALDQGSLDALIDTSVAEIEKWVRQSGTILEKVTFSAESVRAELAGFAARVISDMTPAVPADTNAGVVSSALTGEGA
jgi:murein DD-endopeptidase MepM/ murein hydrolase activator NlpD